MKTSNVEPHGSKAVDATRGRRTALAAGSKGMMWRDASTESVGQIRDMTVYGLEFIDHEDGTGELHVGGPGGGVDPGGDTGGSGTGAASVPIYMLNNSGVNLDQGAVVVVDDTADDAVTRTTTAASELIVGIVQEPIEADAIGPVLFNGYAGEVEVTGTVVRGDYLETSTTAGVAQASATRDAGTFGVVTAAADLDLISDSAVTEQDSSVTSLTITMPDSVTDPDSAGRILFLALWRDPSVTSDPTITGWTRIGSTSGFWYYYRFCTVGDTASASWTTASPAAAIVALLHPTVASIQTQDYDSGTTAAEITGLDGSPHYAIAALQGSVAVPAGWTSLGATAVLTSGGAPATDLLIGITLTQDPGNTTDWTNPQYVNNGAAATSATVGFSFNPTAHRLIADLGAPASVSTMWGQVLDGATDTLDSPEYSDDGSAWTTITGSWGAKVTHNGEIMRQYTITGGPISHRYFRCGKHNDAGAGNHGVYSWATWEIIGTVDLTVSGMLVGQYPGRATTITSPFTGASAATDGVFALNLHVEPKPSAILYGPDLGGGGAVAAEDVSITDTGGYFTGTDVEAALQELGAAAGGTLGWFIPEDYGAAGDGTTDDTTPVADAVAAYNAAGGGVLYFPNKYLVTAGVTLTEPGIVLGGGRGSPSGAGTTSEVICASATAVIFTVQDHVQFRDLQIRSTAATPSAGALVALTSTTDIVSFDGCMFRGGWIGLDIQEGGAQNIHNCFFIGQMKYALKIRNISSPDGGDHTISDCYFASFDSRTADAAIRIESAGGSKITNCKINYLNASGSFVRGIDVAPAASVVTSILLVHGNSIENVSGDAIRVTTVSTSQWDFVSIVGNQFGLYSNTTGNAIEITCANVGEVDGMVIANNMFRQTGGGTPVAIALTKVNDGMLVGNVYEQGFAGGNLSNTSSTNIVNLDLLGATPSGELSGTWDAITVDPTHSGSSHAGAVTFENLDANGDVGTGASQVAEGDHTHTGGSGSIGAILLESGHAVPFTFDEILQASDGSDFLYASE